MTNTKKVVQLEEIVEVPEDYIECTVCGMFKERTSYMTDGRMSRTNCFECYNIAPYQAMKDKSDKTKDLLKNSRLRRQLQENLKKELNLLGSSIPVEEMIEALMKLPKGSKILITQEGYYAQGDFADIQLPEHYKENYYSIGNSSQHY